MNPNVKTIFFFLFIFFTFTAFAQETDYVLGKKLLEKGDYESAVEHFTSFIKKEKDYRAFMGRAQAFIQLKEYNKAIKDYSSAIDLEKEDSRIYYNRGNCFLEMGEEQAAFADFNEALKLDPANYHAYNSRGFMYFQKDSLEKAEEDYLRAISLNLNFRLAYFNLADLHVKKGDLEVAMELIAEYIQYNKQDYKAFTYLGRLYLKMGNIELASKFLGTSLSIEINQPDVVEEVGQILVYYLKDYPSAIEFFNTTAKIKESSEIHYLKGMAHFYQSNFDKALESFIQVRETAKDTIYQEVELLIVSCLSELDRKEEVIQLLDSLEKVKILPAKVALQKSLYFMKENNYKQSLKYLESSIDKEPIIGSFIQKAFILTKMEKYKQAIALYDELDTSKVFRDEIYLSKAQAYFQNQEDKNGCECLYQAVLEGRREQAIGTLKKCNSHLNDDQKKVLKILDLMQVYKNKGMTYTDEDDYNFLIKQAPSIYEFRLWRGIFLKSKKRYKDAVKDFSECITVKPNNFEGYYFAANSMLAAKDTNSYIATMTMGIHKTKAIELYYARALFYMSIEDYEYAYQDLKELLQTNPSYTNAYFQLGELFRKTDEKEKACKYYKQALLLGHEKARLEYQVNCQ